MSAKIRVPLLMGGILAGKAPSVGDFSAQLCSANRTTLTCAVGAYVFFFSFSSVNEGKIKERSKKFTHVPTGVLQTEKEVGGGRIMIEINHCVLQSAEDKPAV
jgi:hypothetical protein